MGKPLDKLRVVRLALHVLPSKARRVMPVVALLVQPRVQRQVRQKRRLRTLLAKPPDVLLAPPSRPSKAQRVMLLAGQPEMRLATLLVRPLAKRLVRRDQPSKAPLVMQLAVLPEMRLVTLRVLLRGKLQAPLSRLLKALPVMLLAVRPVMLLGMRQVQPPVPQQVKLPV